MCNRPWNLQHLCELWPPGLVQNHSKTVFKGTETSQDLCPEHENLLVILDLCEVSDKNSCWHCFFRYWLKLLPSGPFSPSVCFPVHQVQAFLGTEFTQCMPISSILSSSTVCDFPLPFYLSAGIEVLAKSTTYIQLNLHFAIALKDLHFIPQAGYI